jgi:hypothetical protein
VLGIQHSIRAKMSYTHIKTSATVKQEYSDLNEYPDHKEEDWFTKNKCLDLETKRCFCDVVKKEDASYTANRSDRGTNTPLDGSKKLMQKIYVYRDGTVDGPGLSESQIAGVQKALKCRPAKNCCDDDKISRRQKIDEFIKDKSNFVSVKDKSNFGSVEDLRRFIPLLVNEVYVESDERCTKKVMKGFWGKIPVGWPDNIPFADPNNNLKADDSSLQPKKPKKELLEKMFTHLVSKYKSHTSALNERYGCETTEVSLQHLNIRTREFNLQQEKERASPKKRGYEIFNQSEQNPDDPCQLGEFVEQYESE